MQRAHYGTLIYSIYLRSIIPTDYNSQRGKLLYGVSSFGNLFRGLAITQYTQHRNNRRWRGWWYRQDFVQ